MSKATKSLYLKFAIFSFVVLMLTITPIFMSLWDKANIWIFGWPLAQISVFSAALLMVIALNIVFRIENKLVDKETEMRKRGDKIEY